MNSSKLVGAGARPSDLELRTGGVFKNRQQLLIIRFKKWHSICNGVDNRIAAIISVPVSDIFLFHPFSMVPLKAMLPCNCPLSTSPSWGFRRIWPCLNRNFVATRFQTSALALKMFCYHQYHQQSNDNQWPLTRTLPCCTSLFLRPSRWNHLNALWQACRDWCDFPHPGIVRLPMGKTGQDPSSTWIWQTARPTNCRG